MLKTLILGSAAGLITIGGAQAADLPIKAKAIEYVRVCSLYGAGFYYIPGTDTCIKLSGYIRVEMVVDSNNVAGGNYSGAGGAQNRYTNAYTWRSRETFDIDTRTATDYGVVRTFFDGAFSWTDDNYSGGATAGSSIYGAIGSGASIASAPNNASAGAVAGGTVGVYFAFLQFAGFTMGKAISQFSMPWTNYPGNNFDGLVGGGGTVTGVNQFSYTADFGNGISGSLSAQDQTVYYQAGVLNVGTAGLAGAPGVYGLGAFGTSDYAGTIAPDLVAMFRVDQAWGLFQISAAAHDNHAAYYGGPVASGTELAGHPSDKWGWAGQVGLSIKNIPTGPGDTINVQAVYTDGATRYNIQDLSTAGSFTYFSGANLPGAYQSVGFGIAPDSVFATGTSQQLVQTWGMRGAYTHNWDPYWNTSVYGAYAGVHYTSAAQNLICGVPGLSTGSFRATYGAGVTSCNPDYNVGQIGLITRWTPVKNLTFSGDLTFTNLDQKMAGTIVYPGSTGIGKPAAVYELKDQNTLTLLLRAQRNW